MYDLQEAERGLLVLHHLCEVAIHIRSILAKFLELQKLAYLQAHLGNLRISLLQGRFELLDPLTLLGVRSL